MTTKKKRVARQSSAQPASGLISAPEIVDSFIVRRTIGEDIHFGQCSHALQLLPNGAILILVTSHGDDGAIDVSKFLLGEEVPGTCSRQAPTETTDAPA